MSDCIHEVVYKKYNKNPPDDVEVLNMRNLAFQGWKLFFTF